MSVVNAFHKPALPVRTQPIEPAIRGLHVPFVAAPALGIPPLSGTAPRTSAIANRAFENNTLNKYWPGAVHLHFGSQRRTKAMQCQTAWESFVTVFGALGTARPTFLLQIYWFYAKRIRTMTLLD